MYGSSFVERRAASPNPLPRTTHYSVNNYNNNTNGNSSESVVSRSTSASRSRSATVNRHNSDDASSNGRSNSNSRGRSRYATINGPVRTFDRSHSNSRARSVSAERRARHDHTRSSGGAAARADEQEEEGQYPTLSSDSASLGRAISRLESSRNGLHTNNYQKQKHGNSSGNSSSRNNRSSGGPVSLLKQAADSYSSEGMYNNNIYAASALTSNIGAGSGGSGGGVGNNSVHNNSHFAHNGRRGSYDTVQSSDSTMSHLSVSTVNSHSHSHKKHHPHNANRSNNTADNNATMAYPERSTLGLQRSPPLSAASHRHSSLSYYNNNNDASSPTGRDASRRRYSEVTDSTDANYSAIRHHDYALEDIHTDPSRPPVYAASQYTASNHSRHADQGDSEGETQFYPIHHLDPTARTINQGNVVIEGKQIRRGGNVSANYRTSSPKGNTIIETEHVSSSSGSSGAGEGGAYHRPKEQRSSAFNSNNYANKDDANKDKSSGTQSGNNNEGHSNSFYEMKALDYINQHYRSQPGYNSYNSNDNNSRSAQGQGPPTQRPRSHSEHSASNTNKRTNHAPTPWTLSKYNTHANTNSSTNHNNGTANKPNANTNTSLTATGVSQGSKRAKSPQLAVYRGRSSNTATETANATDNTINNELRRTSIPKVPVPATAVDVPPAGKETKETVFHNAAQAEMAEYIESMRRRKV